MMNKKIEVASFGILFIFCLGLLIFAITQQKHINILMQHVEENNEKLNSISLDLSNIESFTFSADENEQKIVPSINSENTRDLVNTLMNFSYLEETDLLPAEKMALALGRSRFNKISSPTENNDYKLSDVCQFESADFSETSVITRVEKDSIPSGYELYYCDQDITYGAGYYVHHTYTGGIPGTGTTGTINAWYGPFAPSNLVGN